MGRRKSYNREEVTERAMKLFWRKGYHGTSTRDLSDAMGINAYSIYAEFGSKEALYDAAIARYEHEVVQGHFGRLELADSSLEDVRAVLEFFGGNTERENSELGCLICNAGTELAPSEAGSRASTARFVARVSGAFEAALGNARARGELPEDAPIRELACFFTTQLIGIFVLCRARVGDGVVRASADQALARLDEVVQAAGGRVSAVSPGP